MVRRSARGSTLPRPSARRRIARTSGQGADRTYRARPAAQMQASVDVAPCQPSNLRAEDQAATRRRVDDVARHLIAGLEQEVQPAAMHRNKNVRLKLLELGDHLLEIVLRRRPQMEATKNRVHLLDTGNLL